jgi:hypothetical protein
MQSKKGVGKLNTTNLHQRAQASQKARLNFTVLIAGVQISA